MSIWGDGVDPPYVYAARIEKMRTRAERSAALAEVPEHIRHIVRAQVINDLDIINAWARRVRDGYRREDVPAVVLDAADLLGIGL